MEDESTESLEFDEDGKTKKKKKKKKKERKIGDIQVQDFAPTSTASAL